MLLRKTISRLSGDTPAAEKLRQPGVAELAFRGVYYDAHMHLGARVDAEPYGGQYRHTVLRRLNDGNGVMAHDVFAPGQMQDIVDAINEPDVLARINRVETLAGRAKLALACLGLLGVLGGEAAVVVAGLNRNDPHAHQAPAVVVPLDTPHR